MRPLFLLLLLPTCVQAATTTVTTIPAAPSTKNTFVPASLKPFPVPKPPNLAEPVPTAGAPLAVAGSTAVAGTIVTGGYSSPDTNSVERVVLDDVAACRLLKRDPQEPLRALGAALANLGDPDAALRVAPDAPARDTAWWNLAKRALQFGRDVDALAFAYHVVDPESRVRLMLAVAQLRLLRGRPDLARPVVRDASILARQGLHCRILADCALLLARCGERDAAKQMFETAGQVPIASDQLVDDAALVVSQCQCQAGFYDAALVTAGHDAAALHFLIGELCRDGEFARAKAAAAQINQPGAGINELEAIATAQSRAGRRDEAVATLDALLPAVQADDHRATALVSCAMAYAAAGRIDTANRLYEQARHLIDYQPWLDIAYRMAFVTRHDIFDGLGADGRDRALYQALTAVRAEPDPATRVYPLLEIALAQKRNGDAAARTTLLESLSAANAMLDRPCTAAQIQTALLLIAPLRENKVAIVEFIDPDAPPVLDAADTLANRVAAQSFNDLDRESVAVMLAGADCFPAAFHVLLPLKRLSDETYRTLAKLQTRRHGPSAAFDWVLALHPRNRAFALAGIAEGLQPEPPHDDYPYPLGPSWNLG